uniref:CUB domain-containing protein n=1 Tax=Haemonchus contortus TaxID=6289 RepID=A0A7I4Y299_HAECO
MYSAIVVFFYSIQSIIGYVEGAACTLPWPGVWIKADREFNITQHSLGPLGSCRSKNNDQYLLSSNTERGECFRCLIVFPVHENVLQYKTTQCIFDSSMTLDRCRHHFSGDTTMHTLFRKEATAIQCPIEAPLNFTYHTSAGTCSSRISSITRCAEWTRLSFRYQACPENPTKEASVSEVECIASWQSLGHTFFAARVGNRRGESYRCFIVDQSGTSGRIGISADASCQELTHIGAATTTLNYKQDHEIHPLCDFPDYMHAMGRGRHRQTWESIVTGRRNVVQDGSWVSSYKLRNDTVWTCLESRRHEHFTAVRTHVRRGCQTGYQCVQFYRMSQYLVQVNFGQISLNEYEDCSEMVVDTRDTLVVQGAQEECPLRGRYTSAACQHPLLFLGCNKPDEIQIATECNPVWKDADLYSCAAHYELDGDHYLIVKDELSGQYQCLKIHPSDNITLKMYDHVSCDPQSTAAALPSLVVNISHTERCESSFLAGFLHYSRGSTMNIPTIALLLTNLLIT